MPNDEPRVRAGNNAVSVNLLVTAAFFDDIFAEAKKIVTHQYQWCVVHDFARGCVVQRP